MLQNGMDPEQPAIEHERTAPLVHASSCSALCSPASSNKAAELLDAQITTPTRYAHSIAVNVAGLVRGRRDGGCRPEFKVHLGSGTPVA